MYVKRTVAAAFLQTALCMVVFGAAPVSAEDVGHGCVGSGVSVAAHTTQRYGDMGFGAYVHSIGENPGALIQANGVAPCTVP